MFCNQCGAKNYDDARYCSSCGNILVQPQHSTQIPPTKSKVPSLWNPNAAANWSLLFTPVFGSYLQMKNWEALGNNDETSNARNWLIFSIVFILFINFGTPFIWSDPVKLNTYPRSLGFLYIIVWYFSFARIQPKYVKDKLKDRYQKKSWTVPLLSAVVIFFVSGIIILAVSDLIVQKTQPKQTTKSNYFDQYDEKKPREENTTKGPYEENDIPIDNLQKNQLNEQVLQCEPKRYKASKYGLDFYGFTQYSIKNKNPIISQLNWSVTNYNPELNPSSTSGSIRVELRAFPKSIENSLESYLIGTYYPNFSNTNNILNVGAYASNITSTAQSSSIPSGNYCVVALLQEYSESCSTDEHYCGVAWIQFKDPVTF